MPNSFEDNGPQGENIFSTFSSLCSNAYISVENYLGSLEKTSFDYAGEFFNPNQDFGFENLFCCSRESHNVKKVATEDTPSNEFFSKLSSDADSQYKKVEVWVKETSDKIKSELEEFIKPSRDIVELAFDSSFRCCRSGEKKREGEVKSPVYPIAKGGGKKDGQEYCTFNPFSPPKNDERPTLKPSELGGLRLPPNDKIDEVFIDPPSGFDGRDIPKIPPVPREGGRQPSSPTVPPAPGRTVAPAPVRPSAQQSAPGSVTPASLVLQSKPVKAIKGSLLYGNRWRYEPLKDQNEDLKNAVEEFKKTPEYESYQNKFKHFNSEKKDLIIYQYVYAKGSIDEFDKNKKFSDEQVKSLKEYHYTKASSSKNIKDFLDERLGKIDGHLGLSKMSIDPAKIEDKIFRLNKIINMINGNKDSTRAPKYCGYSFSSSSKSSSR